MKDTLRLWKEFENNKYDICLSQVILDEIGECPEPKRSVLYDYLSNMDYRKLEITDEVMRMAEQIVALGILTKIAMMIASISLQRSSMNVIALFHGILSIL